MQETKHLQDWSKIVYLYDDKFFVTGGSQEVHGHYLKYSNKAAIVDTKTGLVTPLPDMSENRQAQGICFLNGFVYCCGGITGYEILASCERFNLNPQSPNIWKQDVPDMTHHKFSMSLLPIDKAWIYSFGGENRMHIMSKCIEIERLNSTLIT